MRKNSDILIILLWIILTFVFIITPILENSSIRTILGIPTILFIPGYVLIAALFPKKNDLGNIERIALSFGLSIIVISLLGLILNFTFRISLIPILITLYLYMITIILVIIFRREKIPLDKQFEVNFNKIYDIINNINWTKRKTEKILIIILVFSIILSIGIIRHIIMEPKIGEKFTEFYIVNSSSREADNYPTNLRLDAPTNILAGVVNHEYTQLNYTIQVSLDKNILTSKELTLNNNETWENNVTILPKIKGNNMKLELFLFKENNLTPYRELHLWVNIT